MERLQVTQEGLEKMKAELAAYKARTRVVAAAIEHARGFGDLSENGDYHAAKEEQAILAARIRATEDRIARAEIFDEKNIDSSKAFIGATVRVLNKKTRRENVYVLTSPVESDMAAGKISVQSPVGVALLGHSVGETVVANVPAGALELEIVEISR